MSVEQKIIEILAEQAVLEPSDITPTMAIEEIGLDSMGLVETVFSIEEAFDISVPFNANDPDNSDFDLTSVATIVTAVQGLIAGKDA